MNILKFVSKSIVKRYLFYPLIIGFIMLKGLDVLSSFELGKYFIEKGPISILGDQFNVVLPYEYFKYYFAYAVGFSYGTISMFLPIHKLKLGIFSIILIYLKLWMCVMVFAAFAMMWIPVEMLLIAIGFLIVFKRKNPKKRIVAHSPIPA